MRLLPILFTTTAFASALAAQDARVSVLHGIPGLNGPVDVFANGNSLFSFDYGDQRGPLELAPGTYLLEVRQNNNTLLSLNAPLAAGDDVAVIAHLDENGAPVLAAFANDVMPLTLPASRLLVRHTAQAPAVDIVLRQNNSVVATIPNVSNGQEVAADVAPGQYSVELNVAGTSNTAFGPVDIVVENGRGYGVFATGVAGAASFTLQTQVLQLAPQVTVVHGIPGLGAPVTVAANGASLFTFDFLDTQGPLVIDPGTYTFDVIVNGSTALSGTYPLGRLDNFTVVAHLDAGGTPQLTPFANDTSFPASDNARVVVRHAAAAPAVDITLDNQGANLATFSNVVNGNEVGGDIPIGNFDVSIFAAGTTTRVFGPAGFRPQRHVLYEFLAVGDLANSSFNVIALTHDLLPAVPNALTPSVGGTTCGPMIGTAPATFGYGEQFDLVATGAPAGAMAIVQFGDSITSYGPVALPAALGPFGAPGCFLNTNAISVLPTMSDGQGEVRVGYLVPRALATGFGDAFFQVGVLSNANTLGVVTSEYLQLN